ncbi:MAG: glutathione S-transferase family protein [Gammaproteobacteria bacterium]|nr:glutathione S-transferase family protein [Gammaproteobacteria bacterium]MDH3447472.1 glutathione S-transferase family protein [Gammaproteobacteria bacterium]
MRIYGDIYSGNCYKIKLICALLAIEHEWVAVDIMQGETRVDSFLALNPNGQIPVCITDDGENLTESNAILYYLAQDSDYWPRERLAQTRVLEWQFFEQYSHEPKIAVARFIKVYQGMPNDRRQEYEACLKGGYRALDLMERHLQKRAFLVGDSCSIADISLFAYTHVAPEGGFDLAAYPRIRDWIASIQLLPGFVAMPPASSRAASDVSQLY